jgi:hypothetical protein
VRHLPNGYFPQAPANVSILVTPGGGVTAYAVEDAPPSNWAVSNIDNGGAWDGVAKKVKWGPFFDSAVRTLKYKATPPVGTTGTKTFSGTANFDGISAPITGDYQISLLPGLWHPADANHDFRIPIAELTGYGAAWKNGAGWPEGPSPIPVSYLTRAGFLWRSGEVYHYDPTPDPNVWPSNALVWVTGVGPAPVPASK